MSKKIKPEKFSRTQLSRILGEHEACNLVRGGASNWSDYTNELYPSCCVNQAAFNEPASAKAVGYNPRAASWFDYSYDKYCDSDKLLEKLEPYSRKDR